MVRSSKARLLAVLNPLLEEALGLPAAELPAWLERQRERDPAVARELEALLAIEEELDTGGFLTRADWIGAAAPLQGRRLGAYTLERALGQGGMGMVWLAHRSDGRFEGVVAIKLLKLALLDPVGSERFRREGTLLARLSHPGIARLLDAGVTEQGQPYLVLEYVDGARIDHYAERQRLGVTERLALFRRVLDAVGHAHAHLIVHRDLKPSNILVAADGGVKLLDFGIAKLLEPALGGERSALTRQGGEALTPEYAAPEQVQGEPITTATDVYALGVLLYVLLSGRHPTGASSLNPAEAMRALVEMVPDRLGLGDLDTILAKALRKNAAERYQTVASLDEDIGRYLRQEPVSARPDSFAYRTAKFLGRHRAAVTAGLMVGLLLLATTAFSLVQMREATRQRDLAILQGKRADAQIRFQELLMSQVGEAPLTMRQIVDRARGALEQQYAADSAVLGPLLVQLSRRYAELGLVPQREQLLLRAESLSVRAGPGHGLAEVRCELADLLRTRGRYEAAWAAMNGAHAVLRTDAADPTGEVSCLMRRSQLAEETGRGEESERSIRRAIAVKDSSGETGDREYVNLLTYLAAALDAQGRARTALEVFQRADSAMEAMGEGETVARMVGRHDMAITLRQLGRTAEAERVLHGVIRGIARSDSSGWIHWQPLIHYAEAAMAQGLGDTAAVYFGRLVEQAKRDGDPYWEGRGTFGLVRARLALGRLNGVRPAIARFRSLAESRPDLRQTDDHRLDPAVLDGMLSLHSGDTAGAHTAFMGVLRRHGFFEGKRPSLLRLPAVLAAESAISLGRPDTALRIARQVAAAATIDSLAATTSFWVGEAKLVESRALLAQGDTALARRTLRLALAALRSGGGEEHPRVRQAELLLAEIQPLEPLR